MGHTVAMYHLPMMSFAQQAEESVYNLKSRLGRRRKGKHRNHPVKSQVCYLYLIITHTIQTSPHAYSSKCPASACPTPCNGVAKTLSSHHSDTPPAQPTNQHGSIQLCQALVHHLGSFSHRRTVSLISSVRPSLLPSRSKISCPQQIYRVEHHAR